MLAVAARYREYEPCAELRPFVRAFFTFLAPLDDFSHEVGGPTRRMRREIVRREGDPYWSALFADGHVSIVFYSGTGYRIEGLWHPSGDGPRTHVIGAMSSVHAASPGECLVQVGAYFCAGRANAILAAPASEFTNRAVALQHFWGDSARRLDDELGSAKQDSVRVALLETALLSRLTLDRSPKGCIDLPGLAAVAQQHHGIITVESMADLAGVSRQYLTRAFHEGVGVAPKLYCRLARFRATLQRASQGGRVDWADLAISAGYSDQTHMIAEFREFCGRTPEGLRREGLFHPFATDQPIVRQPTINGQGFINFFPQTCLARIGFVTCDRSAPKSSLPEGKLSLELDASVDRTHLSNPAALGRFTFMVGS